MNKTQRAVLVTDQYCAGFENGKAIAQIVIKQFPNGFTSGVGAEIHKITDKALAHVIDSLRAGGVTAKYRKPFSNGFNAGLAKTFTDYANECAAAVNSRTNSIG